MTAAPVYDPRAVALLLGRILYTDDELATFGPPPKPLPGFLTFYDPGWSILKVREAVRRKAIFYDQDWYDRHAFALKAGLPRYRQLRMEAPKNSFVKSFVEQTALLSPDEEVPTARTIVMGMALHFLATGTFLFPDVYIRTADQTSDGRRVFVGNVPRVGLLINALWGGYRDEGPRLAVARKS